MTMTATASKGELSSVARHIARLPQSLFAEQGYDATSVREIVETAGVAKPTLYYYFRSKEGLAQALLTVPLSGLVATLRQLVTTRIRPDPVPGRGHRVAVRRSAGRIRIGHGSFMPCCSDRWVGGGRRPRAVQGGAVRLDRGGGAAAGGGRGGGAGAGRGLLLGVSRADRDLDTGLPVQGKATRPGPGQPASARSLARFRRWTGPRWLGKTQMNVRNGAIGGGLLVAAVLGARSRRVRARGHRDRSRHAASTGPRVIPVTVAPLERRTDRADR